MCGGALILVAGPSGSGKDTLIAAAQEAMQADPRFVFARRIITRTNTVGELHIPVSADQFAERKRAGEFFLDWDAHGLSYALPASLLDDLAGARSVIANVSRRVVEQARSAWANTHVVSVTVKPDVLRHRLSARGRETPDEIEARVRRASDPECEVSPPFHTIDNSGDIGQSIAAFLDLLLALGAAAPQASR